MAQSVKSDILYAEWKFCLRAYLASGKKTSQLAKNKSQKNRRDKIVDNSPEIYLFPKRVKVKREKPPQYCTNQRKPGVAVYKDKSQDIKSEFIKIQ